MFSSEEKLEVEPGSELYLPRTEYDRVVDPGRRCSTKKWIVRQNTSTRRCTEIDTRYIRGIHLGHVRTIEYIESLSKQLKIHALGKVDPLRDAQVGRKRSRTTMYVSGQRNAQESASTC